MLAWIQLLHLRRCLFQVCELDIIFNFEKAYFMLDEFLLGGEVQETSKKNVLKAIAAQDLLQEVSYCLSRGTGSPLYSLLNSECLALRYRLALIVEL